MAKKGFLNSLFGGSKGGKGRGGSRSSGVRSSSSKARSSASSKRTSSSISRSSKPGASRPVASKQTKTPPKTSTTNRVFKAKNEFRYNTKSKHKEFVFGEVGNKYKAVGITHSPQTFGRKNMPLKVNPQKGKTEPAYIRNGIVSAPKKDFGKKPLNNHKFGADDYPMVKAKIRNYKKRVKSQKSTKKRTSSGG